MVHVESITRREKGFYRIARTSSNAVGSKSRCGSSRVALQARELFGLQQLLYTKTLQHYMETGGKWYGLVQKVLAKPLIRVGSKFPLSC
jgi:hypothetical protein